MDPRGHSRPLTTSLSSSLWSTDQGFHLGIAASGNFLGALSALSGTAGCNFWAFSPSVCVPLLQLEDCKEVYPHKWEENAEIPMHKYASIHLRLAGVEDPASVVVSYLWDRGKALNYRETVLWTVAAAKCAIGTPNTRHEQMPSPVAAFTGHMSCPHSGAQECLQHLRTVADVCEVQKSAPLRS